MLSGDALIIELILSSLLSIEHPKRAFQFQNMCLQHKDCLDTIKNHWLLPARHVGLKKLWEKLKTLKQQLRYWNKHTFGNIFDLLKERKGHLQQAKQHMHDSPSIPNKEAVATISMDYQSLLNREETF